MSCKVMDLTNTLCNNKDVIMMSRKALDVAKTSCMAVCPHDVMVGYIHAPMMYVKVVGVRGMTCKIVYV